MALLSIAPGICYDPRGNGINQFSIIAGLVFSCKKGEKIPISKYYIQINIYYV